MRKFLLSIHPKPLLHISASAGYNVYKSVPFGPVGTLLPYFARRAAENRVVLQGTRKEQDLLQAELSRRLYNR